MPIVFENKHFSITLDQKANVTQMLAKTDNKSVIKERAPFAKLVLNDRRELYANSASLMTVYFLLALQTAFAQK